jgi:hypothetical protein
LCIQSARFIRLHWYVHVIGSLSTLPYCSFIQSR